MSYKIKVGKQRIALTEFTLSNSKIKVGELFYLVDAFYDSGYIFLGIRDVGRKVYECGFKVNDISNMSKEKIREFVSNVSMKYLEGAKHTILKTIK